MTATSNRADIVFWVRARLQAIPSAGLLELQDRQLVAQAELASEGLRQALVAGADPYLADRPAIHCMYLGDVEALQHGYSFAGLSLLVTESGNFALVNPNVDAGPPREQVGRAQQLAQLLFRPAPAPLQPVPFRASDESVRMSNMGAAMGSIPGSIHAAVVSDRLYFIVHKPRLTASKAAGDPPEQGWLGGALRSIWDRTVPQPLPDARPYFGERGPRAAPAIDPTDNLFWSRWGDESLDPNAFHALSTAEDERSARTGSSPDLERLLRPEAALYGPGRQHAIHRNPDRLLHRYDVSDLALLAYESEQHVNIRVSASRSRGESGPDYTKRIVAALFQRPATLRFSEGKAPDEDIRFQGNVPVDEAGSATIRGALLLRATPQGTRIAGLHIVLPRAQGGAPLLNANLKAIR